MNSTFSTQKEVVRANAVKALEYYKGNRTHTARGLGIGIRTLQRMLAKYNLKTYLLSNNWQRAAKLADSDTADSASVNESKASSASSEAEAAQPA